MSESRYAEVLELIKKAREKLTEIDSREPAREDVPGGSNVLTKEEMS